MAANDNPPLISAVLAKDIYVSEFIVVAYIAWDNLINFVFF